jgi:hypothetical protein
MGSKMRSIGCMCDTNHAKTVTNTDSPERFSAKFQADIRNAITHFKVQ